MTKLEARFSWKSMRLLISVRFMSFESHMGCRDYLKKPLIKAGFKKKKKKAGFSLSLFIYLSFHSFVLQAAVRFYALFHFFPLSARLGVSKIVFLNEEGRHRPLRGCLAMSTDIFVCLFVCLYWGITDIKPYISFRYTTQWLHVIPTLSFANIHFCLSQLGVQDATCLLWVEARDVAKYPTVHSTPLPPVDNDLT